MNKAQQQRVLTFVLKTIKGLESIIEQLESVTEKAEDIKTPAQLEREKEYKRIVASAGWRVGWLIEGYASLNAQLNKQHNELLKALDELRRGGE